MKIQQVEGAKAVRLFLDLPKGLYDSYPAYVHPLDKDIEAVFDPSKNKLYRHGACARWIIFDENNQVVGRIAAFYHKKMKSKPTEIQAGGFGFFECINDQKIAFQLFDLAKNWLEDQGFNAMDGPVNFGERNAWWGLLVNGFDQMPNYQNNFHPPYYQTLFEAYGCQNYFEQFTFSRPIDEPLPEIVQWKAERIGRNAKYRFCHLERKKIDTYIEDFRTVFNQGWAKHPGVTKMSPAHAQSMIRQLLPILDERIIWFAYYEDAPVGFFIMIPEINPIVQKMNGKLGWIQQLRFLWNLKVKGVDQMYGIIFGIVPDHQGKGLEGALIHASSSFLQSKNTPYKRMELLWIGDFNPRMLHLVEQLGAKRTKKHITYRKLFNMELTFQRMPVLK